MTVKDFDEIFDNAEREHDATSENTTCHNATSLENEDHVKQFFCELMVELMVHGPSILDHLVLHLMIDSYKLGLAHAEQNYLVKLNNK